MNITVKSDFQAVIEMLEDKKFSSFWESMLKNELDRYASSIDELKEALEIGDVNVLKEINIALKKSNMIKATPDIKQWLTEVMDALRKQNVADYLVIFWDEFTSLLEITERRSILNCMQDIAELSKAPRKDDSKKNILHVLSGEWSSDAITRALDSIDEKQIVLKGPDEVYEVSSSAMPMEKIQAAKDKLYLKYEDVSSLLDEYIGYRNDITKAISNADGFNRITEFSLVWGSLSAISMESKLLKAFSKDYAAKIAIIVFRGDTPTYDKKSNRPEATLENQKNLIQALSQRETMKDIVFVIADTTLGQQRFEGVIEAKARETVAKDTKVEDPTPYEKRAIDRMYCWRWDWMRHGLILL